MAAAEHPGRDVRPLLQIANAEQDSLGDLIDQRLPFCGGRSARVYARFMKVGAFLCIVALACVLVMPAHAKRVQGTAGADTLWGSAGADVLLGRAGDDRLLGLGGADTIDGGPGRDRLESGNGDDLVRARDGQRDAIRCGYGQDKAIVDAIDQTVGCETVVKPAALAPQPLPPVSDPTPTPSPPTEPPLTTDPPADSRTKGEQALEVATRYLGTPYKYGGASPVTGFDSSGLVQYAYAEVGVTIPRNAYQQIEIGVAVDRQSLRPGDLIFFRDSSGTIHHVGMFVAGTTFIHAPHTGDVIRYSDLSEPYYNQQYSAARRIAG